MKPVRAPIRLASIVGSLCCIANAAWAQDGSTGPGAPDLSPPDLVLVDPDYDNPMTFGGRLLACGGLATAGTPIAGNAAGGGNSGDITVSGIPGTASVLYARLYWTVLTDSDAAAEVGKTISFDGNLVSGEMVGFAMTSPCFPQANTVAWTADVTEWVSDPGNGTYALTGFPGDNNVTDSGDFSEGASLVVAYADAGEAASTVVSYRGLAVSDLVLTSVTQELDGFVASGAGSATWVPVIGNGQVTIFDNELLAFSGGAGTLNFDDSLDGATTAFAAETCSYGDDGANVQCYWDDDAHDVGTAFLLGDTSATVDYVRETDCHSLVAMELAVPADDDGLCEVGGEMVDAACPPGGDWRNHGDYVSCVAEAKEAALSNLGCLDEARLAELSSCIVNPRARSNVGKPGS